MKKINILSLLIASFLLFACSDDKDPVINDLSGADGSLISFILNTPSQSEYTLLAEDANEEVMNLTCEQPDYGFQAGVTYTVQICEKGNSFDSFVALPTTGNGEKVSIKTFELNDALNNLGMTNPAMVYNIDLRLKAVISNDVASLYSNVISLAVIPYSGTRTPVYFVGDIFDNSWNNNDTDMMLFADNDMNDMLYTHTGFVKGNSQFKIIQNPGDWGVQWGYGSDGKLSSDGGNIEGFTADGYYTISLDLANNTYSIEPHTGATTEYSQISFIGDFNGWDADLDLVQSTYDKHIWIGKNVVIPSDGGLKIRVNHGWDTSFGGADKLWGEKQGQFAKFDGGDNVNVKAGTYFVKFNDLTKHIIMIEQ